jgi:hypothetical protein
LELAWIEGRIAGFPEDHSEVDEAYSWIMSAKHELWSRSYEAAGAEQSARA